MSNDRDQEIVQAAISDTGSGLLEFLPALGAREAIAFGDGVTLPVRIKFHELPKQFLPRSSTAKFSEKWQVSTEDESILHMVVERWRSSGHVPDMDGDEEVVEDTTRLAFPNPDKAAAQPSPAAQPGQLARATAAAMAPPGGQAGEATDARRRLVLRRTPEAADAGAPGAAPQARRAPPGDAAPQPQASGDGGQVDIRARLRRKGSPLFKG